MDDMYDAVRDRRTLVNLQMFIAMCLDEKSGLQNIIACDLCPVDKSMSEPGLPSLSWNTPPTLGN